MNWYYADDLDNQVSVDESQLPELVASQTIKPTTPVWNDSMTEWKPCADVRPDLFGGDALPPSLTPAQSRNVASAPQPGIAANQSQTDSVAVCALVFGILGILSCFTLFSIAGIICGHIARKRALENPTANSNAGMALTGIITGYAGIILSVLVVIVYFLFIAAAVASEM
ncbi:MAG: DUF4190 domain-containing protein [Verrucomicrobiota bacterium]|nr:DUF4190 domain-containing protein [Verrucomicrobiota bacterium]